MSTPSSYHSDQQMLTLLRRNDQSAWAGLYDRYGGVMFTLVSHLTSTPKETESIFKDAFLGLKTKMTFFDRSMWLCPLLMKYTFSFTMGKLNENNRLKKTLKPSEKAILIHFLCGLGICLQDVCDVLGLSETQGKLDLHHGCLELRQQARQRLSIAV